MIKLVNYKRLIQLILLVFLFASTGTGNAQYTVLPGSCIDIATLPLGGALPPDFDSTTEDYCGCLVGQVLLNGQPIPNIEVTMTYNGESISTVTDGTYGDYAGAVFALSAVTIDETAKRGAEMIISAEIAGQTISQTVRAFPDDDGLQHITLAAYDAWGMNAVSNTDAAMLQDDVVWLAGENDIAAFDLATAAIATTHSIPDVQAFASTPDGDMWAVALDTLYEFDGVTWQSHSLPFTTADRIAIDPSNDQIWLGLEADTGDRDAVATLVNGSYEIVYTLPANVYIRANSLAAADNSAWIGTDSGVFRWDGVADEQFTTAEGAPSNSINSLHIHDGNVWVGTNPALNSLPRGGIGFMPLPEGVWTNYSAADGLPPDPTGFGNTAPIHAIVTQDAVTFAATSEGVYVQSADGWVRHSEHVSDQLVSNGDYLIGLGAELYYLPLDFVLPMLSSASFTATLDSSTLQLNSSGDVNEVAWEWTVDGKVICNDAECTITGDDYAGLDLPDSYMVTYRTQYADGVWSAAADQSVTPPTAVNIANTTFANTILLPIMLIVILAISAATIALILRRKGAMYCAPTR